MQLGQVRKSAVAASAVCITSMFLLYICTQSRNTKYKINITVCKRQILSIQYRVLNSKHLNTGLARWPFCAPSEVWLFPPAAVASRSIPASPASLFPCFLDYPPNPRGPLTAATYQHVNGISHMFSVFNSALFMFISFIFQHCSLIFLNLF